MRVLSPSELITIWEQGLNQIPVERGLSLLAMACADIPLADLAKLTIGQRDGLLLKLRQRTFGSQLVSIADCPRCGESLELNFTVGDIQVSPKVEIGEVRSVNLEQWEVQFRLPNSLDFLDLHQSQVTSDHLQSLEHQLLQRCLLQVTYQGEESEASLPPSVVQKMIEQMAHDDPQAEVKLGLSCPACGHEWQTVFDIVSFFWREIEDWVYQTLREVHELASVYGWGEAEILAMSPQRRQLYLSMVNQ